MYFVSVLWDEKNNNKSKSMISYTIKSTASHVVDFQFQWQHNHTNTEKNVLEFHTLFKTFQYFLFKRKNNTCVGNSPYQCALLSSTALLRLNIGKHIQTRAHIAFAQSQSVSQPDRHKHTLSLIRTVYYAINIYSSSSIFHCTQQGTNVTTSGYLTHVLSTR